MTRQRIDMQYVVDKTAIEEVITRYFQALDRALPDQVRVLPREEVRGMPWRLFGIAAAVSLIVLLAWQLNLLQRATPPDPMAQSLAQPDPLPMSSPATTPATAPAAPPAATGTAAP